MFKWIFGGAKPGSDTGSTPPDALPTSATEEESIKPEDLKLLATGMAHVEPISQQELDLTAEYRRLMIEQSRKTFSDPSFDLPSLPASATRIIELINDPDTSLKKVSQALQLDPVLTAKFLRLANSPFYRGNREVQSIQLALERLGTVMVKSVVWAIALNNTIIRERRLGQRAMALWEHSINTAFASQTLAARLELPQPAAFTLGLMHDIGKLPTWIMINILTRNKGGIRPEVLDSLVEDTHADVGQVLVEVWNMPVEVRLIVGGHHKISSLNEASAYVKQYHPSGKKSENDTLSRVLCCVILADRALAALGLAQEPGDLTVGESCLAADMGLSKEETMDYLCQLPAIVKENGFNDL